MADSLSNKVGSSSRLMRPHEIQPQMTRPEPSPSASHS